MFFVVEFLQEKSVEGVPSLWVINDGKTCLWPENVSRVVLKKMVECTINPEFETELKWSKYNIRIITTVTSFSLLEKKVKKNFC